MKSYTDFFSEFYDYCKKRRSDTKISNSDTINPANPDAIKFDLFAKMDFLAKENNDLRMLLGQIRHMKTNMIAFAIYVQDEIKNNTPHSKDIRYMIEDFCSEFGNIRIDKPDETP